MASGAVLTVEPVEIEHLAGANDLCLRRAANGDLYIFWRIWFELGATQQYYPLAHSAFWTEAQLWGDHLLGYHLVNIVLHALSHPRCPWQFWTKPPIPESIRQKRIVQNGLMGRRLVWFSLFYSFALVQALGQKSFEGVGLIRDYVPEGKPREQRHISTVDAVPSCLRY